MSMLVKVERKVPPRPGMLLTSRSKTSSPPFKPSLGALMMGKSPSLAIVFASFALFCKRKSL